MNDTTAADTIRERDGRSIWASLVLYLLVPAVIAGLMAYYLLRCRGLVGELGFPLDDSWIHVRFAQNLARGHGFSFNPGQPTSTTTGPLWTLLFALGYRITGEYLLTPAVLNWFICVLVALTASALARTFVPTRSFGAAVAVAVAITIPLPWLALSGMEPPLFMWLTLLGILLHVRLRTARGPKALAPTAVFALAALARPECLLLFPLAMLDRLLVARCERWDRSAVVAWLKQLALHTPLFLLIVAPLFIYNYRVIGRPLPSSYYIKAMNYGLVWALATDNEQLLWHSLLVAPAKEMASLIWLWTTNNAALILPFLFAVFWLARTAGAPAAPQHRSFLIPLLLIVQPVAWAMATDFHRAPAFQGQRYVANLGPLYLILGMAGAWWAAQMLRPPPRRVLLPAGLALILIASLARQPSCARLYAHNVKNITEMHVVTARWLKQHVSSEAYLCLNDVGAIAAITGCRVLDTQGLISPETLACLTLENVPFGTWRQRLHQVMVQEEPDYMIIVTRPGKLPAVGSSPFHVKKLFQVHIEDNITAGGPIIAVYQTEWCKYPPKPSPDAPAPP